MTTVVKTFEQAGATAKGMIETGAAPVDLSSTQTLTNKTLTAPVLGGSVTGTYTLAGTPTITAPTITAPAITGTSTIGNGCTLTTPVLSGSVTGTYTLAGTPTITAPAISAPVITGAATIANGATLTTPAIAGATITGTVTIANGATITTPAIVGATLTGTITRTGQTRQIGVAAKIGTTAGWAVNAANNIYSWTVAAGQTNSTLVIPIVGLKVGATITAFGISGFLTSAGNTVTLDAALRSQTAASGSLTDALVASMTQISATGNTLISSAGNGAKTGLSTVVANDVALYLLLTATTAASTTVGLSNAVTVTFTEA